MTHPHLWQVSEITISYHSKIQAADMPHISSSRDAETILRANWSLDIELLEEFNVLFLTTTRDVKGIYRHTRGGIAGVYVDAKIIFAAALKAVAAGIILAHNHPSGSVQPSQSDVDLTRRMRHAGEFLELPVLDHLILGPHSGYYSFADEGTL